MTPNGMTTACGVSGELAGADTGERTYREVVRGEVQHGSATVAERPSRSRSAQARMAVRRAGRGWARGVAAGVVVVVRCGDGGHGGREGGGDGDGKGGRKAGGRRPGMKAKALPSLLVGACHPTAAFDRSLNRVYDARRRRPPAHRSSRLFREQHSRNRQGALMGALF
jgi:hypothetical protein